MKSDLAAAFGERLAGIVLFGSEARGGADPDSDIDVLVLLEGKVDFGADLRMAVQATYPLSLEVDRPIDPIPASRQTYEAQRYPLYRNARKEGVAA